MAPTASTASLPNDESIKSNKPSLLLSLPPELWLHVFTFTRDESLVSQYPLYEVLIYRGEMEKEGYKTLIEIALAHRFFQPFAQEALLNRLDILSNNQLAKLVASLEGSDRLKEHALKTGMLSIAYDGSEGIDDSLLIKLSLLCPNVTTLALQNTPVELSTITRFSKLKVLDVGQSTISIASDIFALDQLESISLNHNFFVLPPRRDEGNYDLLRPFFNSLTALRRIAMLDTDHNNTFTNPPWKSILSQITHLHFIAAPFRSYADQMDLAPGLEVLNVSVQDPGEEVPKFLDSLSRLNLREFQFSENANNDWSKNFDEVRKMYETVIKHTNLKVLSLFMVKADRAIQPLGSDRHKSWVEFKKQIRTTCAQRGIKIISSDWQRFATSSGQDWSRSDITWVD